MQLIKRKEYLKQLINWRDKKVIKVITGVRRCGKSTLMDLYKSCLLEQGVANEQIISINFEDYDYIDLLEPRNFYAYVKERILSDGRMTYCFFDEIQNVKDFERVVDSLYIKPNVDIYITGSNAYMLSSELATLLSGRYVEIKMLPLSFKEYVEASGDERELARKYRSYIETSSFPYVLDMKQDARVIREYLNGIYNTIVVKDITQRNKFPDTMMLESVLRFAYDNIGNILSTKKIADTMTSDGRKIDTKTVEKYLNALMESYMLYQCKRYNIKGKQYLKTLDKYYAVDMGMRKVLLGSKAMDAGHILENIVYLELLRRGYDVYIGKVDDLEVDFVAMDDKGMTYYQVSATVRDEKTLKRELASLQSINDNYPKILLTLDDDPEMEYAGIRKINALDWLLGK
ncbi:ATP-binding protein [Phascolarctobacterium succinatutens]|uniref:ATP-binding protein n=1 Tax=Phascolarctobacterium succinatutens TaxID=626940 RepID=UPI0026EFC64A|nr:ATP-binding protein [Phascolarctobacterium succinatutens]